MFNSSNNSQNKTNDSQKQGSKDIKGRSTVETSSNISSKWETAKDIFGRESGGVLIVEESNNNVLSSLSMSHEIKISYWTSSVFA